MLLPYNVDRGTRSTPIITYTLIGLNVTCFLLSVLIANLFLQTDKIQAELEVRTLLSMDPVYRAIVEPSPLVSPPSFQSPAQPFSPQQTLPEAPTGVPDDGEPSIDMSPAPGSPASNLPQTFSVPAKQYTPEQLRKIRQWRALVLASKNIKDPEGYRRYWIIEHMYDSVVLEPHYSVLNSFAYRANNPSPVSRLLSMVSAMFLHGDIEHIFGNMLFLWVFGRAAEEFLGRKFFSSIYFLSGIGATLIDHAITMVFSPQAIGIPNLGASGAIAGVLGLFAVRFYRTKVRVFYVLPTASWIFVIAFLLGAMFAYTFTHDATASAVIGVIGALVAIYAIGREWAWGAFRANSAYVIGVWVVLFNLVPAIWKMFSGSVGGVAHWAHIGGFALGAMYAAIIGGVEEGKSEYQIEDAKTALDVAGSEDAIAHAEHILARDPNNVPGLEVMARAYDRRKNFEVAATYYERAIESAWKSSDRDTAARLYIISHTNHPRLPLRPGLLLNLSSHYIQNTMWNDAAGVLVRLIEEHPTSNEGEIALLRSAQLWMRQFGDPAEAARQLELFIERYPLSAFLPQAKDALTAARRALPQ